LGKIIATTKKPMTNGQLLQHHGFTASFFSTSRLAGWLCNWTSSPQKLHRTGRNNGSNLRTPTNSQGRRRQQPQQLLVLLQGREMHSVSSGEGTENQTLDPTHNNSLALASSNAAAS
jgi:hypothetical protein